MAGRKDDRAAPPRPLPLIWRCYMYFAEIITTLNDAMGTDLEDLDGVLMFDLDGCETVFQTAEDKFIMTADLGLCQEVFLDRLTSECLKDNYMFAGVRGSSLALNPENGHLFLQRCDWLDRLTREKLIDTMDRFSEAVMKYAGIIRSIQENQEYPEDSSAEPSPSFAGSGSRTDDLLSPASLMV